MSRTLLMALRSTNESVESEPVVINTDSPRVVVIELDDGGRLELNPVELRAAIQPERVVA